MMMMEIQEYSLSILYVLKCAISECFIFVLYTQGNKPALIQGWIMPYRSIFITMCWSWANCHTHVYFFQESTYPFKQPCYQCPALVIKE